MVVPVLDGMVQKNRENFHFLLPTGYRIQLRVLAKEKGLTMAWFVRAILAEYRARFGHPPRVKSRQPFERPHVRFQAIFYGDKSEYFQWARAAGMELAPIVREIIGRFLRGDFDVDFANPHRNKLCRRPSRRGLRRRKRNNSYASAVLISGEFHRPSDYWPSNPDNNLALTEMGLRRKKRSYVADAIQWYLKKFPEEIGNIAV